MQQKQNQKINWENFEELFLENLFKEFEELRNSKKDSSNKYNLMEDFYKNGN